MSDDTLDDIAATAVELADEANRDGMLAYMRLADRHTEVGHLMAAAARGDLIDRPLSATEREVIRDALLWTYCCLTVEGVRDLLTRGQTT